MLRSFTLRLVVAIALIGSFLGSPLAAANLAPSAVSAVAMQDMDCCPDSGKAEPDKQCPLMVLCVLKVFQSIWPAAVVDAVPRVQLTAYQILQARGEGLCALPPDHPPRSLA
jgi:hypothetical protein